MFPCLRRRHPDWLPHWRTQPAVRDDLVVANAAWLPAALMAAGRGEGEERGSMARCGFWCTHGTWGGTSPPPAWACAERRAAGGGAEGLGEGRGGKET